MSDITNNELIDELRTLDSEFLLAILALANTELNHLKIQKIVYILSKLLNKQTDAVPYKYGAFSESLMEQLESKSQDFIKKENNKYKLTEKGLKAYNILAKRLSVENKELLMNFLETLSKMDDKDLLTLSYFLIPEMAEESEIKDEVEKRIKYYKNKAKIRKEGEEIIIDIQ